MIECNRLGEGAVTQSVVERLGHRQPLVRQCRVCTQKPSCRLGGLAVLRMELFAAASLVEFCVCTRVYGAMEIVENTTCKVGSHEVF